MADKQSDIKTYSGSGTSHFYRIEVRTKHEAPHAWGDFIITRDWRDAGECIRQHPAGVPNHLWCEAAEGKGLLTYECAMAMAAWLHAGVSPFGSMIETRLVEIKFEHQYSYQEIGVSEPLRILDRYYGHTECKFGKRARGGNDHAE